MALFQRTRKLGVPLFLDSRISSFVSRALSQCSEHNFIFNCNYHQLPSRAIQSAITNIGAKQPHRPINTSSVLYQEDEEEEGKVKQEEDYLVIPGKVVKDMDDGVRLAVRNHKVLEISVEASIRYMQSEAYKNTYGDEPVWKKYRRNNFPQHYLEWPRISCIQGGVLYTGSACPICRDDYLVVDYRNVELLKQFISPQSGKIYFIKKTCVCQRAHKYLEVAIARARDSGLLVHDVEVRKYDYKDFYSQELLDPNYRYIEK